MKNVPVLICDGQPDSSGDIIDISGVELPKEVPVTLGFGYHENRIENFVGKAVLRKEGDRVVADITFETERVPKELIPTLIPAVAGYVIEREGKVVKRCRLSQLSVSGESNADPRIGKLGEQD